MNSNFRRAMFFVIVALALLATWRVGRPKGPVTDDPTLAGSWTASERQLDLREDGRYVVLAVGTAGALSVAECGRWRSLEGNFQMRVLWQPTGPAAQPLLLSNPGLRAGTAATRGDQLALQLKSARPGKQAAHEEIWLMQRAPPEDVPTLSESDSHWLERSCDIAPKG